MQRRRLFPLIAAIALAVGLLGPAGPPARPSAAAPAGDRTVIATLFEWNWNSVATECRDFLGPRGYGYVAFSMGAQPYLNHLTIYGTRATLRLNLNTMTVVLEQVRRLPKLAAKLAANLEPAGQMVAATVSNVLAVATRRMKLYPGIGENIRRFYRSLDEGDPSPVSAEAGIAVVRMLNEIQAQLERGLASDSGARPTSLDLAKRAREAPEASMTAGPKPAAEKDASWTS